MKRYKAVLVHRDEYCEELGGYYPFTTDFFSDSLEELTARVENLPNFSEAEKVTYKEYDGYNYNVIM